MVKLNQNRQIILSEQDAVEAMLSDVQLDEGIFADIEPINIYNSWCDAHYADHNIVAIEENDSEDYLPTRTDVVNWHMPDEYKNLDIWNHILDLCPDDTVACARVTTELHEFEKRNMLPVLKFLLYLVDTCRQNNVVLGVGRGSSVASYVLYLIGVHKVDSIKYDLDIKEFLK